MALLVSPSSCIPTQQTGPFPNSTYDPSSPSTPHLPPGPSPVPERQWQETVGPAIPRGCSGPAPPTHYSQYLAAIQTEKPRYPAAQHAILRRGLVFIGYGQRHLPTKILGQQLEQDMTLVGLGSTGPGRPGQLREPGSQGWEMRLPQGWHTTSVSHPYKSSV